MSKFQKTWGGWVCWRRVDEDVWFKCGHGCSEVVTSKHLQMFISLLNAMTFIRGRAPTLDNARNTLFKVKNIKLKFIRI